jgi:hypothetical protein
MYQWTADHSSLFSDFPDSNLYGVLVTKGAGRARTFVADAGANTIGGIMPGGNARAVSYIPNENFGGVPRRHADLHRAGPRRLHVPGHPRLGLELRLTHRRSLQRVACQPERQLSDRTNEVATGLTTITACTFHRQGNFWATEIFAGGPSANPPGDIVRIPFAHSTVQAHFGLGELPVPGGIAQGPDGAMYVTVGSSAPGVSGESCGCLSATESARAGRRRTHRAPTGSLSAGSYCDLGPPV